MPLSFPKVASPTEVVGRTPWSARVPLDPLLANEISFIQTEQADEGVGCGPGGPPPHTCSLRGIGKTKWHWDVILPALPACSMLRRFSVGSLVADLRHTLPDPLPIVENRSRMIRGN